MQLHGTNVTSAIDPSIHSSIPDFDNTKSVNMIWNRKFHMIWNRKFHMTWNRKFNITWNRKFNTAWNRKLYMARNRKSQTKKRELLVLNTATKQPLS